MKLIPRNDYVLVELDKKPVAIESSGYGLESESAHERQKATVLDTGPGRFTSSGKRILIDLPKGTRVWLFPGDRQIVDDNENIVLIRESSILGIIDATE